MPRLRGVMYPFNEQTASAVKRYKLKSLILAQIERWRHA